MIDIHPYWLLYFVPMILIWVALYIENDPVINARFTVLSFLPGINLVVIGIALVTYPFFWFKYRRK